MINRLIIKTLFITFGLATSCGNLFAQDNIDDEFTSTFLIYYGGGAAFGEKDYSQLAKFDFVVLDRFRYKKKYNTWSKIKRDNTDIKIFLYQLGPETSEKTDEYQSYYLNNISRYNDSRNHSQGNLNHDNKGLFLLDVLGRRARVSHSSNNFILDFGSKKFFEYWIEATRQDILNQPWAADGIMIDNGLTYHMTPMKKIAQFPPAKYSTRHSWDTAMHSFLVNATSELQGEKQQVIVNRGNSRFKASREAWENLDQSSSPPDIVFEEGAFVVSWGAGDVQFFPSSQWLSQIELASLIENSSVAFLSHADLGLNEKGVDSQGRTVSFEKIFFYAFASYQLAKNADGLKTYFSFDYDKKKGPFRRISWFDIYRKFDFGPAISSVTKVNLDQCDLYFREFQGGNIYVNPSSSYCTNFKMPEGYAVLELSLNGVSKILEKQKVAFTPHDVLFAKRL